MSKISARLELKEMKKRHPEPPFLGYVNKGMPEFNNSDEWKGAPVIVTKIYFSGSGSGFNYRVYRIDGGCFQTDLVSNFARSISIDSQCITPLKEGESIVLRQGPHDYEENRKASE